jgi:hypothetical protein
MLCRLLLDVGADEIVEIVSIDATARRRQRGGARATRLL